MDDYIDMGLVFQINQDNTHIKISRAYGHRVGDILDIFWESPSASCSLSAKVVEYLGDREWAYLCEILTIHAIPGPAKSSNPTWQCSVRKIDSTERHFGVPERHFEVPEREIRVPGCGAPIQDPQ